MEAGNIQDNPTFANVLKQIESFEQLDQWFPLLKPFLAVSGADTSEIKAALVEIIKMREKAEALASMPDRFNYFFAERGWIAYESMDAEVAEVAIKRAESGDIDGAEEDLVASYDEKAVRIRLGWMHAIKVFRARMPLAHKALVDYAEGRYHASVPVVLLLLDGMPNDLGGPGFFAEGTDLSAWNSMAAHPTGLPALAKIMADGRHKTTTEPLRIPYRNGILHGRDLGYDNQMVAAKAWAALFAAGDWAKKVERGEREAPPPEPEPTWGSVWQSIKDAAEQHASSKRDMAEMETWQPRSVTLGVALPTTGELEDYKEDTPERKLVEFLRHWRKQNYGKMAHCIVPDHRGPLNKAAGQLRDNYLLKTSPSLELLATEDTGPAMTKITARITYKANDRDEEREVVFILLYEDEQGHPMMRGKLGGSWYVSTPTHL